MRPGLSCSGDGERKVDILVYRWRWTPFQRGAGRRFALRGWHTPLPGYTSSTMEAYKRRTREVIKRFLNHRLSFSECMAALDAALADLTTRAAGEQIVSVRALVLENNEIVMREMERRGPPPFDLKILAEFGDGGREHGMQGR